MHLFCINECIKCSLGTTDVTRTITFVDEPNERQRKMFTLVLIGHIELAKTVFPDGTIG